MAKKATKKRRIDVTPGRETAVARRGTTLQFATVVDASAQRRDDLPDAPGWGEGSGATTVPSGLTPAVEWNEPGDYVEGVLVNVRDGIGPNKSSMYDLRITDKETGEVQVISIWGGAVLDAMMSSYVIPLGSELYVKYLGDVETSRGLNPARTFKIMFRPPAKPAPFSSPAPSTPARASASRP